MLKILLTILVLLPVNLGFGLLLNRVFDFKEKKMSILILMGICVIVFIEAFLAFFTNLGNIFQGFIILFGILMSWFFRKSFSDFDYSFFKRKLFWVFTLIILFIASFLPFMPDHFLYYDYTIRMIREFGYIKGISSLNLFIGQTSFWHIYQAGFELIDSESKINTFLIFVFLIYIFESKKWFLFLTFPLLMLFIQQPTPDLPVYIITIICISEAIRKSTNLQVLFLISVLAVCIKITVFWLPLFFLILIIYNKKFKMPVFLFAGVGIMVLVVKNLYLFGFPIFPISILDFDLPWQPNAEILKNSATQGVELTYDTKFTYKEIIAFSWWQKIYNWFTFGGKAIFNIGLIFAVIIIIIKAYKKTLIYKILAFAILVKVLLILYFSAQFRFFLDVYFVAFILLFNDLKLNPKKITYPTLFFSIIICVVSLMPTYSKEYFKNLYILHFMSGFYVGQLLEPREWEPEISKQYQIGNLKFNLTKNYNYKQQSPALTIYNLEHYLFFGVFPQYAGKSIKDGFIQRKITKAERRVLLNILNENRR